MTTLVVRLPVVLAKRVAVTADQLQLSHEALAITALRLFLRAATDGNEETHARTHARTHAQGSRQPACAGDVVTDRSM